MNLSKIHFNFIIWLVKMLNAIFRWSLFSKVKFQFYHIFTEYLMFKYFIWNCQLELLLDDDGPKEFFCVLGRKSVPWCLKLTSDVLGVDGAKALCI